MENNNEMNVSIQGETKKKSKAPLIIVLVLIIFGSGICAGIYGPKLFKKVNNNDNTAEKENKDSSTDKEEKKEENEEVKKYVKPEHNSKYTFLKEDEQVIKLNGKEYHLLAYYYEDNDKELKSAKAYGVIKEVYLEDKLIVDNGRIMTTDKKEIDKSITEDISYTKKMTTTLNDKKSSDQYLVYFFERDFLNSLWAEDENDLGSPDDAFVAIVVNKDGKVLFDENVWVAGSVCYIWVNNKNEVLDRKTYNGSKKESSMFEEEYDGSKYYSLYYNNVNGETYPIEFKEDHFYYFTGPFTDEGNKDYRYTIEDGELKKELLKEYNEGGPHLIDGAGQGC